MPPLTDILHRTLVVGAWGNRRRGGRWVGGPQGYTQERTRFVRCCRFVQFSTFSCVVRFGLMLTCVLGFLFSACTLESLAVMMG